MDEEPEMVQAGTGTAGERHVVDGLLAEHPRGVQRGVVFDRLRAAEAEGPVVVIGGADVGHHDVEVVAGWLGAASQVESLNESLRPGYLVEVLDGETERVFHPIIEGLLVTAEQIAARLR